MQNITLIALGKMSAPYYRAAAAEYEKRLASFCRLRVMELPEEPIAEKSASQALIDRALEREGRTVLAAVPKGATLVALCIEGKTMDSPALAHFLAEKALSGTADIAFVVGSSHGLAPAVKQAAAVRLSMSPMTFPHQLARVMLLEQIYRAFSINAGSKYHK